MMKNELNHESMNSSPPGNWSCSPGHSARKLMLNKDDTLIFKQQKNANRSARANRGVAAPTSENDRESLNSHHQVLGI